MSDLEIKIGLDDKSPTTWRELLRNIRDTKSELINLQAQGKRGGEEWEKYSQKLQQLSEQKRIVQRETKLTGEQLFRLSRDLTVIGAGIRNIITDFQNLGKNADGSKQSTAQLAASISSIGIQIAAVLPAIEGLNRGLSALGIAGTGVFGALGSITGVIGVAVVQFGLLYDAIKSIPFAIDNISQVLSGQKSIWEGWSDYALHNIDILTFGLLGTKNAIEDVNFALLNMTDAQKRSKTTIDKLLSEGFSKEQAKELAEADEQELKTLNEKQRAQEKYSQALYETHKVRGTANKETTKELKEQLDFLEQFQKKVSDLTGFLNELKNLQKKDNLELYEKVAIMDEINKKQKELNELLGIGIKGELKPRGFPSLTGTETIGKRKTKEDIKREQEEAGFPAPVAMTMDEFNEKIKQGFEQSVGLVQHIVSAFGLGDSIFGQTLGKFMEMYQIMQEVVALIQTIQAVSSFLSIIGLQGGGEARAGHPYIIGEHGAELFVPKQSGVVIPNDIFRNRNFSPENNIYIGVNTETDMTKFVGLLKKGMPKYNRLMKIKG